MASVAVSKPPAGDTTGNHAPFRSPFVSRTPVRPLDGPSVVLGSTHPATVLGQEQQGDMGTQPMRRSVVVSRPSLRSVFGSKKLRIVTPGIGCRPVESITPKAPLRPPTHPGDAAEIEEREGSSVRNLQADLDFNSAAHVVSPMVPAAAAAASNHLVSPMVTATGAPNDIVTPSPMTIATPSAPYKPDAHHKAAPTPTESGSTSKSKGAPTPAGVPGIGGHKQSAFLSALPHTRSAAVAAGSKRSSPEEQGGPRAGGAGGRARRGSFQSPPKAPPRHSKRRITLDDGERA